MTDRKPPSESGAGSDTAPTDDDGGDRLFVYGSNEGGDSYQVLRARHRQVELGELRQLPEGRAIHGEVVRLHPTEDHEQLFDVEVLVDPPGPPRKGPAQVATRAYRDHWDAIFGSRAGSGGGTGKPN